LFFGLFLSAAVAAQTATAADQPPQEGAFPTAVFGANFRKYTPPRNAFSPFYSWDASLSIDVTLFRKSSNAVTFDSTFQTIGTENLGSKISVGGEGYLLGLGYTHTYSADLTLGGGFSHLSSHLTRDLDDKLDEQRRKGVDIPTVIDPSEYNVFYFSLHRKAPAWPLAPELKAIVAPVTFRFNGSDAGSVRPIYLASRAVLWRGEQKSVNVETEHEFGPNYFNSFLLSLTLYERTGQEGRFHVFISVTPGHGFHVSPHVGGLRDGIAFGVRMRFRS
jgi:hypothetical protein